MKIAQTPMDVAMIALAKAVSIAEHDLRATISNCGVLAGADSKQSDESREYFAELGRVHAEAISILHEIVRKERVKE